MHHDSCHHDRREDCICSLGPGSATHEAGRSSQLILSTLRSGDLIILLALTPLHRNGISKSRGLWEQNYLASRRRSMGKCTCIRGLWGNESLRLTAVHSASFEVYLIHHPVSMSSERISISYLDWFSYSSGFRMIVF